RAAFWPFRPVLADAPRGIWPRIAAGIGRRPRPVWVFTAAALAVLAVGMVRLEAHGVPRNESFLAATDSSAGQDVLAEHFPASAGTPAVVIANASALHGVFTAATALPGVSKAVTYVDPLAASDARKAGKPAPGPKVVDGLVRVDVTVAAPADSPLAGDVVRALRAAVHA